MNASSAAEGMGAGTPFWEAVPGAAPGVYLDVEARSERAACGGGPGGGGQGGEMDGDIISQHQAKSRI
jgi:hypothetical protein